MRHHAVSGARAQRGFTLIELGIVLAVAGVLAVAVGAGAVGYLRVARMQRTGEELNRLLAVAVDLGLRDMDASLGCTSGAPCVTQAPVRTFRGADLSTGAVCFDLGCASTPCSWNAVPNLARAREPELLLMAGWGNDASAGLSAHGKPYALCVFKRRVAVATCVPPDDVPTEIGGAAADGCGSLPGTFSCGADRCVSVSKTLATPAITRLGMRQKFLYWDEATVVP